jgi:hypothetical protein
MNDNVIAERRMSRLIRDLKKQTVIPNPVERFTPTDVIPYAMRREVLLRGHGIRSRITRFARFRDDSLNRSAGFGVCHAGRIGCL